MAQIAVTGTAVLLVDAQNPQSPCSFVLRNTGATTVFIDSIFGGVGSGVTTSTGFALLSGDVFGGKLNNGDAIYGVTAGTTITVQRMRLG